MTELERQLLKALENLDGGYKAQHAAWESAYSDLRLMFEATSTENRALRENVGSLSKQGLHLSEQVERLSQKLKP
ncbi:mobilization protein [Pseudomonas putida TRO1]|uniref:Mobilization protein n=1 Tax=Pseudomonas putida TRO1 TaxID=1227924 RepID=A0AAD2ZR53_PSEPU|nr:MbeD family mobilization/exclusion protein [Pseudomonas putida]ENY74684.1 mobilization protein [Pseudomonas putida TRO1]